MATDAQERARQLYQGELLAPMVRASTTPLRTLALHYGADAVYTEELMDRSVTATTRVENKSLGTIDYVRDMSDASNKTRKRLAKEGAPLLLRLDPKVEKGKIIGQIGTGEPELALAAALHIHKDVDSVDLNMGCPKKFSVSGGMGSALLSDPDRACRILRTWRDHLPPDKPISAKIRLLSTMSNGKKNNKEPDVLKTLEFISGLIERGGANAVAIHGRTVGHDAVIPADWTALEEVVVQTRTKYPHIPVLINGDFYTRSEFAEFQQRTGAAGVLLGRPALYNTSLFRKPHVLNTQEEQPPQPSFGYDSPLLLDKTVVVEEYMRRAVRYDIHYKNIKYVVCEMMNNRRAPSPRVPNLPQSFPGRQTIGIVCACQSLQEICQVWKLDYDQVLAKSRPTPAAATLSEAAAPAPAGDHRYEDSYLLQTMGPDAPASGEHIKSSSTAPPAKRTRTET